MRAGGVVLYDCHMTASVRYKAAVVKDERLPLKARPRSAASLVAGGGEGGEAVRPRLRNGSAACNNMWGGRDGKREAELKRLFRKINNNQRGCGLEVGQLNSVVSGFHLRKYSFTPSDPALFNRKRFIEDSLAACWMIERSIQGGRCRTDFSGIYVICMG